MLYKIKWIPDGSLLDQLDCDQNVSIMLADNVTGGLAETCFDSFGTLNFKPDDPLEYPKVTACCPMVGIPIITQASGDQMFYFYDDAVSPIKIY